MKLIWEIAKKEFHHDLFTFRFLIGFVISIILVALITFLGSEDYNIRLKSYQAKLQAHEEKIKQAQTYSQIRPTVIRPPEPLSILNRGFDAQLGTDVNINIQRVPEEAIGEHKGNEYLATYAQIDLTIVVEIVFGLLALLFTFDAISGEKEKGTLKLFFSNSISRSKLILGKYLGTMLSLMIPILASFIIALLIILNFANIKFDSGEWLRILAVILCYTLYISVMILIGLLLSSLTHRSATSLLFCIFVWLIFVVIIPNSATLLAAYKNTNGINDKTVKAQQRVLTDELVRKRNEIWERFPILTDFRGYFGWYSVGSVDGGILIRFSHSKYNEARAQFYCIYNEAAIEQANKIFSLWQRYQALLLKQSRFAEILSHLSPAFICRYLAESFSGTSIADYSRFLSSTRNYRNQLISYFKSKNAFCSWKWFTDDPPDQKPILLHLFPHINLDEVTKDEAFRLILQVDPKGEKLNQVQQAAKSDPTRRWYFDDIPKFSYSRVSIKEAALRSILDITLLSCINILCYFLCFAVFVKYDLR